MDHLPTILLCASAACLVVAFIWYQLERVERAGVRNVAEAEREALRRLQRDTERHNRDLRDAVRNLLTIKPLPVRQMAEPKSKPAGKKPARTKR